MIDKNMKELMMIGAHPYYGGASAGT